MKSNSVFTYLSLLGAITVALGAFGAHGLEDKVSPERIQIFKLGISYQFYHLIPMFVLYLKNKDEMFFPKIDSWALSSFMLGIILFSGSLYLLSIREIVHFGFYMKIIGPATPVGGISFIVGWILMAYSTFFKKPNE